MAAAVGTACHGEKKALTAAMASSDIEPARKKLAKFGGPNFKGSPPSRGDTDTTAVSQFLELFSPPESSAFAPRAPPVSGAQALVRIICL